MFAKVSRSEISKLLPVIRSAAMNATNAAIQLVRVDNRGLRTIIARRITLADHIAARKPTGRDRIPKSEAVKTTVATSKTSVSGLDRNSTEYVFGDVFILLTP